MYVNFQETQLIRRREINRILMELAPRVFPSLSYDIPERHWSWLREREREPLPDMRIIIQASFRKRR